MLDELDDVILEGKPLVSDDPSTWQIPASLRDAAATAAHHGLDPDGVLLDWWEQLESTDTHVWDRLGGYDGVGRLCELADLFQAHAADLRARPKRQFEMRDCVVEATRRGLTLTETARLFGTDTRKVVCCVLVSATSEATLTDEQLEARLEAERLLRDGKGNAEVARATGMSDDVVAKWRDALGIPRTWVRNGKPQVAPEVKAQVMQLIAQGMGDAAIVAHMATKGHELRRMTVGQWRYRRKLKNAQLKAAA